MMYTYIPTYIHPGMHARMHAHIRILLFLDVYISWSAHCDVIVNHIPYTTGMNAAQEAGLAPRNSKTVHPNLASILTHRVLCTFVVECRFLH